MREFKFRIWNKESKCFIAPNCYDVDLEMPFNFDNTVFKDKLEIMQYTGLKDKNSKEIYEGDLILDEFDCINEVYWSDYFVGFRVKIENKDNDWLMEINEIGSIIGNIYENPELLRD